MKLKVKEFKKIIKEVAQESIKKSHPPYLPEELEGTEKKEFSYKDVWNGMKQELKDEDDYNEALNRVLDNLAKKHDYYHIAKVSFSPS